MESPRRRATFDDANNEDDGFSFRAPTGVVHGVAAWARHRPSLNHDDDRDHHHHPTAESGASSSTESESGQPSDRTCGALYAPQNGGLPTLAARYAAGSASAQGLERRRHELSIERELAERDRMKLEALLARYHTASLSPLSGEKSCSVSSRSPQRVEEPAESAGRGPGGLSTLSPIQPVSYDARSPSSPPPRYKGEEAPQTGVGVNAAGRGPKGTSPSPVHAGRTAAVLPLAGSPQRELPGKWAEGRDTSTAVVRPVSSSEGAGSDTASAAVSQSLSVLEGQSPEREAPPAPEPHGREAEEGLSRLPERNGDYARKLSQIEKLLHRGGGREGEGRQGAPGHLSVRTATLDAYRRRGRLMTPCWAAPDALVVPPPAAATAYHAPVFAGEDAVPLVERRPRLRWDRARSGNVLLSPDECTCLSDGSRAWRVALAEYRQSAGSRRAMELPHITIPLYALGTVGVAWGDFVFQIHLDCDGCGTASPAAAAPPGTPPAEAHRRSFRFAVGVTTEGFRGPPRAAMAYLYCSDGSLLCGSGAGLFEGSDDDDRWAVDPFGGGGGGGPLPRVPYGVSFDVGDDVTVVLQLSAGLLSFYRNGRALGTAFRFVAAAHPEPLFPLVLFTRDGDTASFTRPFFT